jgi:hypothetical protein
MPRFSPVVRIKEKPKSAFMENRRQFISLADEFSDAKSLTTLGANTGSLNSQPLVTPPARERVRSSAWLAGAFNKSGSAKAGSLPQAKWLSTP